MYTYQQQMPFYQPSQAGAYMEVENKDSISLIAMPPNDRRVYFDRNCDRFYTVQTDAAGQKAITSYDFTQTVEKPPAEYVTVDTFNEWTAKIEQFISEQQNNNDQATGNARTNTRSETNRASSASHQTGKPWHSAG